MRNERYLTLFCILFASSHAAAQTDPGAEIAAIRAEIGRLAERLDRLEQTQTQTQRSEPAPAAAAVPQVAAVEARTDRTGPVLSLSGDLRYRHETIDEETVGSRPRARIRARHSVVAELGDDLVVGLGLATGDHDPVSANQTLDGGFDRDPFGVDHAYFTWRATDALSFTGGKMANPFFRPGNHHLLYDSDLNPEGLALRYSTDRWFANYGGFWVEERSTADDSILLGGQLGYRHALDGGATLTTGLSYYDYRQTEGERPFFDGAAAGNRLDASGAYASDFNEAELFAELELTAGKRPLTLFADYVVNTEVDVADSGWALGASLGEVSGPGTWRVGYAYQELEADAVIGTFTDSDFAGGGTDNRGHVVELTYALRERWLLGLRYFSNERGADAGNEHDYEGVQADVMFEY
jgi:Putative porin